jgi:hypothetical protein
MAPHTNSGFDISLVVSAQECFLVLRVRQIAFLASCGAALRPALATTYTDTMLFAKGSYQTARIVAACAHWSSTS